MPILVGQAMTISTPQSQSAPAIARASRATGLVVAAIAVQLLVTSMASAATTCSETIERTRVTRLTHCVAQAIRELVDHGIEAPKVMSTERDAEPAYSAGDVGSDREFTTDMLGVWLLNLPPPAIA
jgi:hypothetical protein